MPALVVIEGPNRGAIHALLPETNRVGRDPQSEVTVLDEGVSREHAQVEVGAQVVLRDLGSSNGTWVNGLRCDEVALEPGDEVRVGQVVFLFVGERAGAPVSLGASTMRLDVKSGSVPSGVLALDVGPRATYLLGDSPPMRELGRRIRKVAPTDATVLITGESGTGKELVARALHRNSGRRAGPFVAINGASLRGELLESELFGHEKGAFTGAIARRQGAFELARGGTLFLDEAGELPLETQAALLRVLEGHGYRRVGGGELLTPDVRLLAATNRDLPAAIAAGAFRQDLYYRLETIALELPPLREREGDVALLAEQFLASAAPRLRFSPAASVALAACAFPGNVRELKNLIERLALFAEGEVIEVADLPPAARPDVAAAPAAPDTDAGFPTLRELEREHVAKALAHTGWNKARAARLLGIDRVTLYKRIERYGLAP